MTLDSSRSKLFGSATRTSILVLLALLGESYTAELAKMLGVRASAIKKIVDALEVESIVAGRLAGRTRLLTLNPRYEAAGELKALLWKLGERDFELQELAGTKRKRPRRAGKPI
jgi:predicted transcriptional regulator